MNKSVPALLIATSIICLPLSAKGKKDAAPAVQNENTISAVQDEENANRSATLVHTPAGSTVQEEQSTKKSDQDGINPKTGFPEIEAKPYVMFNEGAAFSQVTRIVYQDDYNRSNFVWQNYLAGVYCEMQTGNMKPVNSIYRVAAYYPFYHTFNGMEQPAKQPILYAFDVYAGPFFQGDMWKYVLINFSFGPHFFYELSDEYHHVEAGGAVMLGIELPVATYWTIINNGIFSVDYGNLGSNRSMQPYDMVWNYQVELGVRFSLRGAHEYAYIHQKPPKTREQKKLEREQRKAAREQKSAMRKNTAKKWENEITADTTTEQSATKQNE
jgi:hypothetical protein